VTDAPAAHRAAELAARQSYGKLVAYLAARTGDVAAAEDALSDAFVVGLDTRRACECAQSPGPGFSPRHAGGVAVSLNQKINMTCPIAPAAARLLN
jgi:hypothetical protein